MKQYHQLFVCSLKEKYSEVKAMFYRQVIYVTLRLGVQHFTCRQDRFGFEESVFNAVLYTSVLPVTLTFVM